MQREGGIVGRKPLEGLPPDVTTLTRFAYERVRAGLPTIPLGLAIEDILLLTECSVNGEWEGQIRYLPLR